jgi:pilus assembly protein CpaB
MMIVISVIIGLAAVVLASRWVAQQADVSTSQVVVAKADIDLGARLNPEMLAVQNWPAGSVPQGAILAKDKDALLKDPKTNEGRVARVSILKGEPISESKLAPSGAQPGLSFAIKEGKRAITVRVNDVVGVAGFALPGNYVDILVNTVDETAKAVGENKTISKIVLEHILLLAVAQETSQGEGKPKVVNAVTLEVTPDQAEKIDLARSVGSLSLVLRNQMDEKPVETVGVYKKDLLKRLAEPEPEVKPGETKPVVKTVVKKVTVYRTPPKKAEPKDQVEVIRGTARSSEEFKLQTEGK